MLVISQEEHEVVKELLLLTINLILNLKVITPMAWSQYLIEHASVGVLQADNLYNMTSGYW